MEMKCPASLWDLENHWSCELPDGHDGKHEATDSYYWSYDQHGTRRDNVRGTMTWE